jgi:EmrB/QacA subfamily drug resistance transporter
MEPTGRRTRRAVPQHIVVAVVYVLAMFVTILDSTVVNVALPNLAADFGAGTATIEWVITGYLLGLAVSVPMSGWLGDRIGTKKVFLGAVVIFTGTSTLCGAAGSLELLVAFRVLQGLGGGMLAPTGLAMLYRAFPPERRAAASKVLIIPTAIAPASGPILGGFLVDHLSWRWVFLINIPIGVVAFAFGAVYLREHREESAGRLDVGGALLSGVGLASVLYALSEGPTKGWMSAPVVVAASVGIAAVAALVGLELRVSRPMLDLRLLGDRLFRSTTLTLVFSTAAFLGLLFLVPQFLQEAHGSSALESGLSTSPEALGVIACSQLVGRLYPRIGPRRLMAFGLGWMAVMIASLSQVDTGTSLWFVRIAMFFAGTGYAFVLIPLQASSFARIRPADTGRASALFNTTRQVSAALGVAVLATALQAWVTSSGAPGRVVTGDDLAGYQRAFIVAAVIAAAGALVALRIRDADAAATMRRRGGSAGAHEHDAATTFVDL